MKEGTRNGNITAVAMLIKISMLVVNPIVCYM